MGQRTTAAATTATTATTTFANNSTAATIFYCLCCSCYYYNYYRSRVTAPEMTTAEARDLEVDGPLWDSHPVNAEPETHEEVVTR